MTTETTAAPPRTKSQVLRSFDVADFPALTGLEEEWRFTPLKRLGDLVTATALTGTPPSVEYGDLPAGVTVSSVDRSTSSAVEPVLTQVPPTPRRRELRELPTPEELSHVDPDHLLTSSQDFRVTPLPGGCLVSFVPRGYRQRSLEWE